MAGKKQKPISASGSAKRSAKQKPRGKPFIPGNQYRIRPGEVKNPSGISGKTLLSEAYKQWLGQRPPETLAETFERKFGYRPTTNAELSAMSMGADVIKGSVTAATEMRKATEGDNLIHGGEIVMVQTPEQIEANRQARWERNAGTLATALGMSSDQEQAGKSDM